MELEVFCAIESSALPFVVSCLSKGSTKAAFSHPAATKHPVEENAYNESKGRSRGDDNVINALGTMKFIRYMLSWS